VGQSPHPGTGAAGSRVFVTIRYIAEPPSRHRSCRVARIRYNSLHSRALIQAQELPGRVGLETATSRVFVTIRYISVTYSHLPGVGELTGTPTQHSVIRYISVTYSHLPGVGELTGTPTQCPIHNAHTTWTWSRGQGRPRWPSKTIWMP
jgi:hypothetical protein